MNFSMFKVLHKAVKNEKIKLSENHKDFDYMINQEWIVEVDTELVTNNDTRVFLIYNKYTGYVSITNKGKDEFYKARNSWLKWILGTIISVSSTITVFLLRLLLKC